MLRGLIRRIGAIRSANARAASQYVLFIYFFFLIYVSQKEFPEFWIRIRMDSHLFGFNSNKVDYNKNVKYMTLSLIPYY
jgi:hypothetical protein